MKKTLAITWILTLAIAASAFAQSYSVSYSDGTVELKTAKGWSALSVGDLVPASSSVLVSQGGSLELTRGAARITILRDGVYEIASLARAAQKAGAAGTGARISQKLQSLTTEQPKSTAAGGVRAEDQGSTPTVTWAEESDETRSEVISLLAQKKYAEAAKELEKALDESPSTSDGQELMYLSGLAYYGAGQLVKAYRILSRISPDPGASWYEKYLLLKAQVLVDSPDFETALGILQPFLSAHPTGETAQLAWLLTYYCQKGLGNASAARAALDAGYQLDPGSETARLIDQQRTAP